MSTGNLSRLDPEEVARAVTEFINATIMARSRPVRPDDDLELAGLDSSALLQVHLFLQARLKKAGVRNNTGMGVQCDGPLDSSRVARALGRFLDFCPWPAARLRRP